MPYVVAWGPHMSESIKTTSSQYTNLAGQLSKLRPRRNGSDAGYQPR